MVKRLLADRARAPRPHACATAPANIALCKYWGKRNEELNLPVTNSLSYALPHLSATTELRPCDGPDRVQLNGAPMPANHPFAQRVTAYLNLFRTDHGYDVATRSTVPVAAGVASSAAGFAALALALDALYDWQLDRTSCSILARLGSGSACRSVFSGFVEWHAGERDDGMDSVAQPLEVVWPDFRLGVWYISQAPKPVSSRVAMRQTRETSLLYRAWPEQVRQDLAAIRAGLADRDIERLGAAAERNALAMHATMAAATPPILYWQPGTVAGLQRIWEARADGCPVFATLDAGPNLKLIYPASAATDVAERFPELQPTDGSEMHR